MRFNSSAYDELYPRPTEEVVTPAEDVMTNPVTPKEEVKDVVKDEHTDEVSDPKEDEGEDNGNDGDC